ncbi:MAG TPA: adenylate/guanylate cyclase domain-containing protein [Planctomycetota bacterium]|nr:adenylate/guanylate cyclase domain-containing protein [Planctomycetota bacterium]
MKIFPKLFLILACIAAVPLIITALVLKGESSHLSTQLRAKNQEVGRATSETSQRALEDQARMTHQQIVQEKVSQLNLFFGNLRRAVELESTLSQSYLELDAPNRALPLYEGNAIADWIADPKSDFAQKIHAREAYSVYHLAPGVKQPEIQPALDRLSQLGYFFAHNQQALPWCTSTYFGHKDGFIVGYPGRGRYDESYDPRARPWYKEAVQTGRPTWTPLYLDRDKTTFVITCAKPVYAHDGKTIFGVAAIDVNLTQILDQLFNLRGLPVTDAILIDGAGQVQVSAAYKKDEAEITRRVNDDATLATPAVAQFQGGEFAPVYEAIQAHPERPSGVISMKGGKPASASEIIDARDGVLYAYGTVHLVSSEGGTAKSVHWYYVVKMPIDTIIKPVQDIRDKFDQSQQDLTDTITDKINVLWLQIVGITVIVLVVAMLIAWWQARSLTRPLEHVAMVAEKVGHGDLNQTVDVRSKDEIGQMGIAINSMIKGLKERDFVKSTFKRFVAASVVDHLIEDPQKLQLGGEKREMTVFFSDLVGFTSTAEKLSPETLVVLINEYLGAMTETIFQHEGTIDKYIGDAIMAFWGAPLARNDHALRACKAALDNVAALRKLWASWEARGLPLFDVRIGINTGPMVVGNMGSHVMMGYTVMGDAVNLGSRLEGANKGYGTRVMISEFTLAHVKDQVEVREMDLLTVSGRSGAVRVYELLGLKGQITAEAIAAARSFEKGLAAYRAKQWDLADREFNNTLVLNPGDSVSKVFLERVAEFRVNPPPEQWDGVYMMKGK